MRIIHDFDPVLLHLGDALAIHWFAVAPILGFIAAFAWLRRVATRGEIDAFSVTDLDLYMVWLILGVVVGARAFHVFLYRFADLGLDPLGWMAVWRGGLSTQGTNTYLHFNIAVDASGAPCPSAPLANGEFLHTNGARVVINGTY